MVKISNDIQKVFRGLIMAFGIYFILVSASTILRPFYLEFLNKNIEIKLVATSQRNQLALANNVRITHITVNGKDRDLSKIDLSDANGWRYDSANDFLYVYNASSACELTIELINIHSLSIGMVREVGSGILDVYLDGQMWETRDLYENVDWNTEDINYETSIFVSPERCLPFQLAVLFALWALCLLRSWKKSFKEKKQDVLIDIAIAGALSIIVILAVSIIQYGDIFTVTGAINKQSQSFLKATVFAFLCILIVGIALDRMWGGYGAISIILVIGSLVSKEKVLNRDVPLLPWDFFLAKEAASVVTNYEIPVSVSDTVAILIVVLLIVLLATFKRHENYSLCYRVVAPVVIIVLLIAFLNSSFVHYDVESNNTDYRVYRVNNYYEQRGFISAFLEYCTYLDTSNKPDNYSKETMANIVREIGDNTSEITTQTPTIIAVMSESFWDLERLDTLQFEEELLPNYKRLKSESRYGELFTHVLNGGTVTSEFEFLTGFSGEFFPQDYMVYGRFLDKGFVSAVSILKQQGYATTALHPYVASNYNREAAYQNIGFDKCLFEDNFEVEKTVRNYISDADLFEQVIKEYGNNAESGQPQFIFTVTMQNHGGYWGNTIYMDGIVDFSTNVYGEIAIESITDYVAGLHESDRALGELVDYFRNIDEDVIIVYFGDHMSNAGPKDDRMLEQTKWADDDLKYDYETHLVPFIVWSNFESDSDNYGIMETGELMPTVFETYGIKANPFWNYIQHVRNVYAASDSEMVVNGESDYREISEMTEEQKTDYEIYRLLQYDYIWGKRYAVDLWDVD